MKKYLSSYKNLCEKFAVEGIRCEKADLENFNFSNKNLVMADLIIFVHALYFVNKIVEFMKGALNSLRPGGRWTPLSTCPECR